MDLGKHIVDKSILDKDERNAGKVDDILLEISNQVEVGKVCQPVVKAIITGPLALAYYWPQPLNWLAGFLYRLLGVKQPKVVEIPWEEIKFIDVVVHLNRGREELGLDQLDRAVLNRFINRLPGA